MDRLSEHLIADLPAALSTTADRIRAQNATIRAVIKRFGHHPHRNPILNRLSTPAAEAHIAKDPRPA